MRKSFKNIISTLLLSIFLFPTIVTLVHHREHFECTAKDENHLHKPHAKCNICSFEFSVFSYTENEVQIEKPKYFVYYRNDYRPTDYTSHLAHHYLLRAPPFRQA